MPRLLRTLALCLGLVVAAPVVASQAISQPISQLMAHDGKAAVAKATKAAAALQSYSDRMQRAGRRPDYAAAPAADLLRVVFDVDRLAALPAPTARDFDWLMDWATAANRGYQQIIFVGMSPKQPDQAKFNQNLQDYQDQITLAMSFLVRVVAREMEVGVLFMAELPKEAVTPIRLAGYQGMRASGVGLLRSVLCVAQGIKPDNVRMLMTAINDTQTIWTDLLSPREKTMVSQQLRDIMSRLSDTAALNSTALVLAAFSAEKV